MAISISVNRATSISETDAINRALSVSETDAINRATSINDTSLINREFNPNETDGILIGDTLLIGFKPTGFIIY